MTKGERTKKGLHGEALRAFRHSVSELKKKGLVRQSVDARSQKPTRYMRKKVKDLSGIFEGTKAGVKVHPDFLKRYREAGYQIVNRRVIVNKDPSEIAAVKKGMPVLRSLASPAGPVMERVPLPFNIRNAVDFEKYVRNNAAKIDAMKEPGEVFNFKIFGNSALAHGFEDIELVLEYLERYLSIWGEDSDEQWESFDLYRITPGTWVVDNPKMPRSNRSLERREMSKRRWSLAKGEERYRQERTEAMYRLRMNETFRERERVKQAEYMRRRREDAAFRLEENQRTKERVRKLRAQGRTYTRGSDDGN